MSVGGYRLVMKIKIFAFVAGALMLVSCSKAVDGQAVALGERPSETGSAGSGAGSRNDPFPLGSTGAVGPDWKVTVVSIDEDSWDVIRAENQFNDPPKAGSKFVIAKIRVAYVGSSSGEAWIDLHDEYLGSTNVTYGLSMDDWCGVIPDDLSDKGSQFPNSTVEGNICWSVPESAIKGGKIILAAGYSDDDRVFFDGSN